MQRNTTGLSSDAQETLKQAASLAAVSRPTREAGGYTNNSNNTCYNNFGGFYVCLNYYYCYYYLVIFLIGHWLINLTFSMRSMFD